LNDQEYIVFGKPLLGEEEIAEVVDSLRAAWLGTGPKVARFEETFRAYIGARHAVALHSCSAGLFLAQLALDIGPGDAVITTPLTFVATPNSVRNTGALPLFADVEEDTGLLDPVAVERLLVEDCRSDGDRGLVHRATGARVRAVLPVHLWGQPADMPAFRRLADRFGLLLIEDAAHAIESTVGEEKVGTTADVSCFSFYATKNICTGEGGMLTTSRQDVADRVRLLASHGLSMGAWKRSSSEIFQHYLAMETGWKLNMMDLQAALGIHQLARLEVGAALRAQQWQSYVDELGDLPGISSPPRAARHGRHALHLFTLRVGEGACYPRDYLLRRLHEEGVGSGVHYLSVLEHPAYKDGAGVLAPNAERIGRQTLSLPLGGALTEGQRRRVSETVRRVAREGGA
jgi:dTDP-4-amino-4,6-dideoxygalactose transaminase